MKNAILALLSVMVMGAEAAPPGPPPLGLYVCYQTIYGQSAREYVSSLADKLTLAQNHVYSVSLAMSAGKWSYANGVVSFHEGFYDRPGATRYVGLYHQEGVLMPHANGISHGQPDEQFNNQKYTIVLKPNDGSDEMYCLRRE